MDPNTHSTCSPDGLTALAAAVDRLAAQDLDGLSDAVRAERVLVLRRLLDRLEGHWLHELADLDARGAAGAEPGLQVGSTAAWLRHRLRMGAGAASSWVRTARALFGGPLTHTAQALTDGALSPAHATVLAAGTQELAAHLTADAEPVLLDAARRLDHPGCDGSSPTGGWWPTPTPPPARPNNATSGGASGWTAWSRSRAAGTRGRSEPAGGPGAADPPHQCQRPGQRQPRPG
jgi:hypothetical protein